MRVALDCTGSVSSAPGGISVYVRNLVPGLARTAELHDRFDLSFRGRYWSKRETGVPAPDDRFRVRRLPDTFFRPFWTRGVQVLHALRTRLPRTRFAREVVTFHDLYAFGLADLWERRGARSARRLKKRQKRYLAAVRRADAVICVSQSTYRDLLEIAPEAGGKTVVIPHGVVQDLKQWVPPEKDVRAEIRQAATEAYLLHIGSISPVRNLPRTIRAFARVVQRVPGARLLLVGGKTGFSDWEEVEGEIRGHGLSRNVRLLGWLEEKEKLFLLARARGLVMFHLHAGFGLPVLEAMVMGVPVALSRRGALPEVAADAALYADAEDVDGISGAMLCLLDDEDGRRRLIQSGLKRSAMYTWDVTARRTYELYCRLVGA